LKPTKTCLSLNDLIFFWKIIHHRKFYTMSVMSESKIIYHFICFSETHPRLMMRSATPVKSDASGSTVSGYGTADSGGSCGSTSGSAAGSACDKTPPYLPRNHFSNNATLGRMNHHNPDLHRQQQVIIKAEFKNLSFWNLSQVVKLKLLLQSIILPPELKNG